MTDGLHIFLILLAGVAMVRLSMRLQSWSRNRRLERIFKAKSGDYDALLSQYCPYYRSLDKAGKERFLTRVLHFMAVKKFDYIDLEPEESMPALVAAAAVQLTFGLESYLLDYFKTIHILKNKYRYGAYSTPFEGHVSQDGIYLSWKDFVKEFTDHSDGQNVGLHEMAHALTYVNFTVDEGRDKVFHDSFTLFSAVARPIFDRIKAGESTLLDPYAATDYQEFWAVCVETFFERPTPFRAQLPELYYALSTLLNQDPLTPEKILPSANDKPASSTTQYSI